MSLFLFKIKKHSGLFESVRSSFQ